MPSFICSQRFNVSHLLRQHSQIGLRGIVPGGTAHQDALAQLLGRGLRRQDAESGAHLPRQRTEGIAVGTLQEGRIHTTDQPA